MSKTKQINEDNFEELTAAGTTIIDFYADWCPPCKALAPKYEEFAEKHGATATIAKINIDDHQALAARFNVKSIPTIVSLKDGAEVSRLRGNVELSELESLLAA